MPLPDQQPNLEDYVVVELTMPRTDTAGLLSIQALANVHGWERRERCALSSDFERELLPPGEHIANTDLAGLSVELWGSEAYGKTAANILANQKNGRSFQQFFYVHDQGVAEEMYHESWLHYKCSSTRQDLERIGRQWWEESDFPFAPEIIAHESLPGLVLSAGAVTRDRWPIACEGLG